MKSTQVMLAGDFNARVGELSNEVEEEKVRVRSSRDKEVNTRGRVLMREMNRVGLYLANGVGAEADFTFEHAGGNGRSVIDLMWMSRSMKPGVCEEWRDATSAMSDHALVTIQVMGQVGGDEIKAKRRVGWKRVNQEWKAIGTERWRRWREDTAHLPAAEMWKRWRRTFEEEAAGCIGRERERLKKHHEGVWDEEIKQLVEMRAKLRKGGHSDKWIRKEIRKKKVQVRLRIRERRNESLEEERRKNPRRYWSKVNQMLGKQRRGMPSVITYEGKEVEGADKMKAWEKMFQGDQMQSIKADASVGYAPETQKAGCGHLRSIPTNWIMR